MVSERSDRDFNNYLIDFTTPGRIQPKHDLDVVPYMDNRVRSMSVYKFLEKSLVEFIEDGDGLTVVPVFDEYYFPMSDVVDVTLIDLIKLLSTGFGQVRHEDAILIDNMIHKDERNKAKRAFRFRSRHPLFSDGTNRHQNICLISGMIAFGIPILPYFDGQKLLFEPEDAR